MVFVLLLCMLLVDVGTKKTPLLRGAVARTDAYAPGRLLR